MGAKVGSFLKSIGDLFKKKPSDAEKISNEVRMRAQELGISPEDYLRLTQNNASIYAIGDGDWGIPQSYTDVSDETIDAIREDLSTKYAVLGIREANRPSFGLNYQEQANNAKQFELSNLSSQYHVATENVDDVEAKTGKKTDEAKAALLNAQKDADRETEQQESIFSSVMRTTEANNNTALNELNAAKAKSQENNDAAQGQLDNINVQVERNNTAADDDVLKAEQTQNTNNNKAAQAVSEAETKQEGAAKTVSDLTSKKTSTDRRIAELEKFENPNEAEQKELTQLKADKKSIDEQLEEAKKADEAAKKKLEEAKDEKTKVENEGAAEVDDKKSAQERIRQEGEHQVLDAEGKLQTTQDQGTQAVNESITKQKLTEAKGKQEVEQQQAVVRRTEQEGKIEVKKSESELKTTQKKGEEEVQEAKKYADDVKQKQRKVQNTDDVYYFSSDEYKQQSNGTVRDISNLPITDNAGRASKLAAIERARQNNPNADPEKIEEEARSELAREMRGVDAARKADVQRCFNQPPSQALLEQACADRYERERAQGHSTGVKASQQSLLPDDDMNNRMHLQGEVGNCWAQSGVTSIASTEEGNQMLLSHMHRDPSRGVTAVHLQEAQNNRNGAGGTGIYTFTDKEIIEGGKRFGTGDGNVTAYMLATEKYLQENPSANPTNNRETSTAASDGATNNRMYEIITGSKARWTSNSGYVNVGINRFMAREDFNNKFSYNALCSAVQNGHTAGNLTVAATNGNSHSFSIVGVSDNGTLLVQEPNNRGLFNEMFTFVDKNGNQVSPFKKTTSINGKPTYECSREAYRKFIVAGTIMRWK